ncbi:MAG: hypothetical protein ACREOS_06590, partial [Candidatus Dormibacteraceae bacterium]
ALFTASILNSSLVRELLTSISFSDSKRPYTKEILMRIDLKQVGNRLSFCDLTANWSDAGYTLMELPTEGDYDEYKRRILEQRAERATVQLSLGL